ncbi:MAG: CPBP family glutamic-type intramembrane protease, partial [Candidatus Dormibacteraeota bacterium]|nr:CPBP family glutamic-type intramembrane protease [Candidatus Dormibacteraeota bacterium]
MPTPLRADPPTPVEVRFTDLVVAFGGAVLGVVAAFIVLAVVAYADPRGYKANAVSILLIATVIIYAGLFLGMLRFLRRIPHPGRWLGLRRPAISDAFLVVGLLVVWFVGTGIIVAIITAAMNHGQPVPSNAREMFNNHSNAIAVLGLALVAAAVVAPICEELFFRGMLYRYLLRRWPV